MANQEHLDILKQGVEAWNKWRQEHPGIQPDLSNADLRRIDLSGANLNKTNLRGANLHKTNLSRATFYNASFLVANLIETGLSNADLTEADLSGASLVSADLSYANLTKANLSHSNLSHTNMRSTILFRADLYNAILQEAVLQEAILESADLEETDFRGANLRGADLMGAILLRTNLNKADLTNCSVHGISTWDIQLEGAMQNDLIITRPSQVAITIDNLEVAQFIYLLLNNEKIRDVIDTITSKVVLILGRFTSERKTVLDALRDELRKRNYTPVLFDFVKPASRDLTETVSTLAHLARFIIIDLTDPSSAPHEVATVIPQTVVPVQPLLTLQPLIVEGKAVERHEYAMFEDLRRRYHWVLPTFRYQDTTDLLASLQEDIIKPAELKAQELAKR